MTTFEVIKSELNFKYPQIKYSFGDIDNFLFNLYDLYQSKTNSILVNLLNHKGKLVILDSDLRFSIYNISDSLDSESLVFEEPYSIYTFFDRKLLYQVSNHNGIFGDSILDSLLLLDFPPASLFYLTFSSYDSRKEIILMNGSIISDLNKNISIDKYNTSTLIKTDTFNQLQFKLINGIRDTTKVGLPYYPIKVYYLETSSLSSINRQTIMSSSSSNITIYEDSSFFMNPSNSGWLVINQFIENQQEIPLKLTITGGSFVNKLISVSADTHYLALDSSVDINLVRQYFNLNSISLPEFENYKGINIKINLSI